MKQGSMKMGVLLMLLLTAPTTAWGLVAGADFFGLDFRFNNPGARANAMGGAFIGLADDATAAFTNPAGLTILTEPEITVEYKVSEVTNRVPDATGVGEFTNTVSGLDFLSLAYPLERTTLTLYRHTLVNNDSSFEEIENDENLSRVDVQLKVVTTGLGIGVKIVDRLSVGVSFGFAELDYNSRDEKFNFDPANTTPQPGEFEEVDDSDTAEQFNIGLYWSPTEKLNLGFVYRYGPEFDTTKSRYTKFEQPPTSGEYLWALQWRLDNTLKIPDVWGAGISYRILPNLTVAADVDYVIYSDLLTDFEFGPGSTDSPSDFSIDDTFEGHLGLEYVFGIGSVPFAVRGGYFYRPDHSVQYTGSNPELIDRFSDKGEDEHIFTGGVGAVLFNALQLDVAAGYGEYIKELTASLVYRF